MTTVKKPTILTKNAFFQIDECNCGKKPFSYHNTSKNEYYSKCTLTKEEFDIKTKKWVVSKKQPCNFYCVYFGERPVILEEVKKVLIVKANKILDVNKILEEKLRLLFKFVFVSNHTATLDEINVLVTNNLKRESRKPYYYPSPGHMRISHYESIEEYRDRIFSKKIVDLSYVVKRVIKPKEKTTDILKIMLQRSKLTNQTFIAHSLPVKQQVKPVTSTNFIITSDDDNSSGDDEDESDRISESSRELSDYDECILEEEIEEIEEIEEPENDFDNGSVDEGSVNEYD